MALFRRVKPPFSLKTLQKDSNCIAIQDPSQVWGVQDFLPRRNLLLATDTLATQNVTVVATAYKLYCQGTGSITLSGTGSGTLQGTGANDRVVLSFTPTAGTLTLTVSGTVTFGMLTRADTLDQSYQRVTDWVSEQYAWAAQKSVPWLRRNAATNTDDFTNAGWTKGGAVAAVVTANQATAPDGTLTADLIDLTPAMDCRVFGTVAGTGFSSSPLYVSVYIKAYSGFDGTVVVRWRGGDGTTTVDNTATVNSTEWTRVKLEVPAIPGASASLLYVGNRVVGGTCTKFYAWGVNVALADCSYQPILATWDATYTSAAIAAGYPISLWQDSAGTSAVNGDNQAIGKMLNYKLNGLYDAIQDATNSDQPKWRLDANGKPYIERDLTNDSLPITLPNLGSNCVIYTAEQNVTLKDSGITLNGSYAPITPAVDYGRIIMAADSRYDAKILKYLDGKRGRQYSLGPELVANGDMSSSTGWTMQSGWAIGSGVATATTASTSALQTGKLTAGRSYYYSFKMTRSAGSLYLFLGGTSSGAKSADGTYTGVMTAASANIDFAGVAFTGTLDDVSVREVIL